jgi:thiol-disulfide isomerase/thioredoxin
MKKLLYLTILLISLSACTEKNVNNAIIEGELLSGNHKEVNINSLMVNSISDMGKGYTATIDQQKFNLQIPLNNIASGRFKFGKSETEIVLFPGDQIKIQLYKDSLAYSGKGANRNRLLQLLKKKQLDFDHIFNQSFNANFTPEEYLNFIDSVISLRKNYFEIFASKNKLEKEFMNLFKVQNAIYVQRMKLNFPDLYAWKEKKPLDSIQLPKAFTDVQKLANLINEEYVIDGSYFDNLEEILFKSAVELCVQDSSLSVNTCVLKVISDSLSGKSKEYQLARLICGHISAWNKVDSTALSEFEKLNTDEISKGEVHRAIDNLKKKQALIGNALNQEFAQTLLTDTTKTEITFGKMMNQYKGNIVYLDMWSLGCGPCRFAMPKAKEMKNKLKDLPIKFVYITCDKESENLWEEIRKVSLTKDNHYRFAKGFNSRLHSFMGINWVPNYMIFDKEGKLLNYNATRPGQHTEKELRELATN